MPLLSLTPDILVARIIASLPGRDRWRLRCSSQRVRRIVLDWPRQPFLCDFTGKDVNLFNRTKEQCLVKMSQDQYKHIKMTFHPYHYVGHYRTVDCFAALFLLPAGVNMVVLDEGFYFEDLAFVKDFLFILRERVHFGYVKTIEHWLDQCGVSMDNNGFYQCPRSMPGFMRIRIGLWETSWHAGCYFNLSDKFAVEYLRRRTDE
jgi:hypothetical protein